MRPLRLSRLSVAGLLCLGSSPAQAQAHTGDRVRMSNGVIQLAEGILVSQDSLRYLVLSAGAKDTVTVRRDDVYKLERFVTRRPYGSDAVARGAGLSAWLGATIGALSYASAGSTRSPDANIEAVITELAYTAIGFVIGSVVAVIPHDVWETVPPR